MTSNLRDHKINSALYQYGVPIAVFAFAAACITIYFRMTVATQRRRRQAAADAEGKESLNAAMKPVLFDTYVADGWWDPRLEDGTTLSVKEEWEEIMPLSVASFGGSATHGTKEEQEQHPDAIPGATATDSKVDASRVRVSVVIRMPCARTSSSIPPAAAECDDETDLDSTPLPYLEFGMVEVDVSRGEGGAPPLPAVEL